MPTEQHDPTPNDNELRLTPADFHDPAHQHIAAAILAVADDDTPEPQ